MTVRADFTFRVAGFSKQGVRDSIDAVVRVAGRR